MKSKYKLFSTVQGICDGEYRMYCSDNDIVCYGMGYFNVG